MMIEKGKQILTPIRLCKNVREWNDTIVLRKPPKLRHVAASPCF
jgi:hypothetical protein